MPIPRETPPTIQELRSILVRETGEKLVEIKESEKITLLSENPYLLPFARKTVVEKLEEASRMLPVGFRFLIITAYRPLSFQKRLWRKRLFQLFFNYPLKYILNPLNLTKDASRYTARPGGSSHQTGTAIDLTILNEAGDNLDMGTEIIGSFGERSHTAYENITNTQKENRELLYKTMTEVGFVNYPREWWHYSYGDRAWSFMKNKKECTYGALKFERSDIIKK